MVYDFLITIKKYDLKFVDQVSQLMYVFAILAFGYFYYERPASRVIYLLFILAILVFWVFAILKKSRTGHAYFRLGLLAASAGWLTGPEKNIWMAVLYAIAGILEKQVKFPREIGFSTTEISFNTLPRKVLKWSEVSNVLIKEGIITIDQKNNKLYQKEIEGFVTPETEREFNDFAKSLLNKPDVA